MWTAGHLESELFVADFSFSFRVFFSFVSIMSTCHHHAHPRKPEKLKVDAAGDAWSEYRLEAFMLRCTSYVRGHGLMGYGSGVGWAFLRTSSTIRSLCPLLS